MPSSLRSLGDMQTARLVQCVNIKTRCAAQRGPVECCELLTSDALDKACSLHVAQRSQTRRHWSSALGDAAKCGPDPSATNHRLDRGRNSGLPGNRIASALVPYWLALKAEASHLADRTSEALEAIREAETLVETSEACWWCAELHRLRGVFLATLGADETQIEALFQEAIRIAKEQKSISLEKRAEATYTEYRRQKTSAAGGRAFRLPLW